MILVIGGIKGGSGKTTLATNLTVMRANGFEKKVLLIDADEQKSSFDWVGQREALEIETNWTTITLTGKSIYSQLQKLKENYDDIIIDVGGRDTTSQRSALMAADKYLIPFKPRSLDIWTLGLVKTMLSEILSMNENLKTFAVINQADPKGADNFSAMGVINDSVDISCFLNFIGNRKSFSNAAASGLGVMEYEPRDSKAIDEIRSLYDSIFVSDEYETYT
jgi:chromosome partitioning protein